MGRGARGMQVHADGVSPSDPAGDAGLVWEKLRSALLQELGAERAERWFGSALARELTGSGLVLTVPNAFIAEWIENTYGDRLNSLACQTAGLNEVRIEVTATTSPALRQKSTTAGEEFTSTDRKQVGDFQYSKPGQSRASRSAAALPEPLRDVSPNLTLDRFVVGSCNRVAYSAGVEALRSPGGTYNPIFVYGGCGLGKTHLLQGVTREYFRQGERRIRYLPCEGFVNRFGHAVRQREIDRFRDSFRTLKVLVLDDVQVVAGKDRTQLELLETIDRIASSGGQVFLASDCRPSNLEGLAEKLLGRFISGLVCRVSEPDFETRWAILKQEATSAGVSVSNETIRHLAERSLGNVRELIGNWVRVMAHVSLMRETVSSGLVDRVLSEVESSGGIVTIDRIIEEVGRRYGVPPIEFRGPGRSRTITLARHIAIYCARVLTEHSLSEIGQAMGGRRHATTSAAYRKIQRALLKDEQLRLEIERIVSTLR